MAKKIPRPYIGYRFIHNKGGHGDYTFPQWQFFKVSFVNYGNGVHPEAQCLFTIKCQANKRDHDKFGYHCYAPSINLDLDYNTDEAVKVLKFFKDVNRSNVTKSILRVIRNKKIRRLYYHNESHQYIPKKHMKHAKLYLDSIKEGLRTRA